MVFADFVENIQDFDFVCYQIKEQSMYDQHNFQVRNKG